ncbi:CDP-glycerol glycerophosphotransferase family protein [soil metagenome]
MTNRLGDDELLVGSRFDGNVIVYYPDALDNTYQVTPWLPAFEALHAELPVTIVTQDSRVTARFRALTSIPVTTIARYGTLDDMLSRSDVKIALYVSHAPRNFESLRFTSLMHVYLGHGDSDKGVSASNQLKAYDYAFLPGEPAVERVRSRLMKFDADAHTIVIGQPQNAAIGSTPRADGRTTVLYAPTWEGAQPSVAYSSVLSHGSALVSSLLRDERFVVEFRPHPLSGVTSREYAAATAEISAQIRARADAGHRVIEAASEPLEASFARADLLVCDVSAVSSGWLPSGKPLVVTRPSSTQTVEADSGLLAALPRLTVDQASTAASVLWPLVADDTGVDERRELVRLYLSALTPEESIAAFVAACRRVADERDGERARLGSTDV